MLQLIPSGPFFPRVETDAGTRIQLKPMANPLLFWNTTR